MSAPTTPTSPDGQLPAYAQPLAIVRHPDVIERALAALCSQRGDKVAFGFEGRWFEVDVALALAAIPGTELDERLLQHRNEINDLLFAHIRRDLQAARDGVEQRELRARGIGPLDDRDGDQAAKAHDGNSGGEEAEVSPAGVEPARGAFGTLSEKIEEFFTESARRRGEQLTQRIRAIVREEIAADRDKDVAAEPAPDPEPLDEDAYVEEHAQRAAQRVRLYQRITKREREILAAMDAETVSPRPQPQRAP